MSICLPFYYYIPKKKSLIDERASMMVLSLAVNGHLTSMIYGSVGGWSFCWWWTFSDFWNSTWTKPSCDAPNTPDSWSQMPLIWCKLFLGYNTSSTKSYLLFLNFHYDIHISLMFTLLACWQHCNCTFFTVLFNTNFLMCNAPLYWSSSFQIIRTQ